MKKLDDILESDGYFLLAGRLLEAERDLLKEIIKLAFVAGQVDELHKICKEDGRSGG